MVTLVVEDVHFSYDSIEALRGVSFEVKGGTVVGVLGPNGAGKSTMLKCLCKVLQPKKGLILVDGKNLLEISFSEYSKIATALLTEFRPEGGLTVLEILLMGRYPYLGLWPRIPPHELEVVDYYVRRFKLEPLLERRISELSDGERQRVLLARAVIQQPRVLILDEPVAHLDIKHQIEMLNLIREWCKETGAIVVMAMHDLNLASNFCDLILLLKDGKIYAAGSPEEVLVEENIRQVYEVQDLIIFEVPYRHCIPIRRVTRRFKVRVHIIGGCGTASKVLSELMPLINPSDITCGVIHKEDQDYIVAKSLNIEVVSEEPYSPISMESLRKCLELVERAEVIIDSGFPVGKTNFENIRLLEYALQLDKFVISLRSAQEWRSLSLPLTETGPLFVANTRELVNVLLKRLSSSEFAKGVLLD